MLGGVEMTFAEKVKHARTTLKLSQEKFAALLGVSFATVNRWEKGHATPTYETLERFNALCKENGIHFKE